MNNHKDTSPHNLIDIGVNLTGRSFDSDLADVIDRALAHGVSHMVVTGTNLEHTEAAIELCDRWPGILFSTAGVHPHHAKEWNEKVASRIHDAAQDTHVRALGECGLDYNRNFSTPQDQRKCFEAQLEMAADLQLPVFLHQRDAHKDFVQILTRWRDKLKGGVAHCFTGTSEEAKAYLDLELAIGITGWICDDRRGQELRQAVKQIPLESLMIETDAPYLRPGNLPDNLSEQLQDRRNEPLVLPHVCRALAHYIGRDEAEVAQQTTKLASEFFTIGG